MGSALTVIESLNTIANVGLLAALIISTYHPEIHWGFLFLFGVFLEIIVNQFLYTPENGGLWNRLFGWHTIPFEYNLIITPILLILLLVRQVINIYEVIILSLIYGFAIVSALFPGNNSGIDTIAAQNWWS